MSYLTDHLDRGELVVYRARVCGVSYIGAFLWLLLTLWPGDLAVIGSTELALTDRRVIGKHGLFVKHGIALLYKDLERINVTHGVLGRLLGFGTVTVIARDGRRLAFKGIADPLDLQRRADEFVERAILGRPLPRFEDKVDDVEAPDIPKRRPLPPPGKEASPPDAIKKTPVLPDMPKDTTTW
ncbi:MAG: PH domain-containing protein [Pseudomonadota bacterium]|nr:PH domain-containing protein [Pseudomonadota bacterium]MDE3037477.1 PH domain-containing protein [Pseudomonadota bacterium]